MPKVEPCWFWFAATQYDPSRLKLVSSVEPFKIAPGAPIKTSPSLGLMDWFR